MKLPMLRSLSDTNLRFGSRADFGSMQTMTSPSSDLNDVFRTSHGILLSSGYVLRVAMEKKPE